MRSITPISVLTVCVLLLFGCSGRSDIIPATAGDNAAELERVLAHYQDSGLKYEAAKFLIGNMGWHVSEEADGVRPDAAILTSDFLVEHIDHAFMQWETSPYAKGLTFDEFCEYLLPYRAARGYGHNVSGRERLQWVKAHVGVPDSIKDIRELIAHYNSSILELRRRGGKRNAPRRDGLNDLLFEDFTDCGDKAMQTCLNLRAMGVPCVVEHNLGYRTFKAHHAHCAVRDVGAREWIKFDAECLIDHVGDGDWTSAQLLNLYRNTYAPQAAAPRGMGGTMPRGFESPCQLDVTHHTVRIKVVTDTVIDGCVPYLATFHRSPTGLQPFTFGRMEGKEAVFDHVVPTVWYVATAYPDGRERIISRPFWVNEAPDGTASITYADFQGSDSESDDSITLRRKYPVKEKMIKRAQSLIGTTIVGANRPDFADARTLWRLDSMPQPRVLRYPFSATGPYRYYQLRVPQKCEVAELEWLADDEPIAQPAGKACDGDMTTAPSDSAAITLALPQPRRIAAINMAPINADNGIAPGHRYELYHWTDAHGWTLHSAQIAEADSLTFQRVPKGALLWLKNLTKGQEEMPFFYRNHTQQFIY